MKKRSRFSDTKQEVPNGDNDGLGPSNVGIGGLADIVMCAEVNVGIMDEKHVGTKNEAFYELEKESAENGGVNEHTHSAGKQNIDRTENADGQVGDDSVKKRESSEHLRRSNENVNPTFSTVETCAKYECQASSEVLFAKEEKLDFPHVVTASSGEKNMNCSTQGTEKPLSNIPHVHAGANGCLPNEGGAQSQSPAENRNASNVEVGPNTAASDSDNNETTNGCSNEITEGSALDETFSFFIDEIGSLPQNGSAGVHSKFRDRPRSTIFDTETEKPKANPKLGTADQECIRLTSMIMTNAVEALRLSGPDADEQEIKKQFRKISLLIHPDKCQHSRAQEAFQVITKAYEEMQLVEMRDKYKEVITAARTNVTKARRRQNKILIAKNEKQVSLDEGDEDFRAEVTVECDRLLKAREERIAYAEKCRKGNEEWAHKEAEKEMEEDKMKRDEHNAWASRRDTRVGDWRDFRNDVADKSFKLKATVRTNLKKESRAEWQTDPSSKKPKKGLGIDESYKDSWR